MGLDMLTSFSICKQLDVCYLSIFVRKVVYIDLKFILDFQQLALEGGVLSIGEDWWVRNLG